MTPLRQRMIVEMIRRGLARRTQESYLWGVISLANHYNRSPDRISERDIEDFLLSMSRRHLAPASVRLAWNGIAFFYRHVLGRLSKDFHPVLPRQRQRQPEILSPREVDAIIQQARRLRNRLLIILAYSGGLRVDEVRRLKWTDIDRDRRTIRIDQGKGQKDRYTALGQRAIERPLHVAQPTARRHARHDAGIITLRSHPLPRVHPAYHQLTIPICLPAVRSNGRVTTHATRGGYCANSYSHWAGGSIND